MPTVVDIAPAGREARRMLRSGTLFAVVVLLALGAPRPAWAYVDPSAGSIFLQLLLGGVAGILVALKLTYRRILGWFGRRDPDAEPSAGGDSDRPR